MISRDGEIEGSGPAPLEQRTNRIASERFAVGSGGMVGIARLEGRLERPGTRLAADG